ncbi:MAG: efflux RND transporter periplasmic adaptor subunit [Pseudomonadota bacterium]
MKRAGFLIFIAAVFVIMAAAVAIRMLGESGSDSGGWGGTRGGIPVAVEPVETRTFADIVEALGTANANESVTITAIVSDTIRRLEFDSGQRVEAGAILVELSAVEEAAGLSEARATLREAQREIDRTRDLVERGVSAQSRLDESNAQIERARARVNAIEAQLSDRIIRAPFDGVVGLREVSVGELVRPGDVIARLDDTSIIKLDFTVPERFLSVLEPGMTVRANAAAFDGVVFDGRIAQIDTRVDPSTRAVTVRAEIDNADGRLRPGMLLGVEVRREERERPAIPEAAVTRVQERSFVYVVVDADEGATVEARDIRLGMRQRGLIEVVSGLEAGERIVAEGVHRVRPGAPVRIVGDEPQRPAGRPTTGQPATASGGA